MNKLSTKHDPFVAFAEVIGHYQEVKNSDYNLTHMKLGKQTKQSVQPKQSRKPVTRVTTSDFICDVELSALRSLSDVDFTYFKCTYRDAIGNLNDSKRSSFFDDIEQRMRTSLGQRFIDAGIYPLEVYVSKGNC